MIGNNIGPISYADSVDLVCNPHYEYPRETIVEPPPIVNEVQEIHGIGKICKEQAYTIGK